MAGVAQAIHADVPNAACLNPWFALRVKSRCEKVVAAAIQGKGYDGFLPLSRGRHRWSDRVKDVQTPLFPGYVFCRLDLQNRLPLLKTPGLLYIVGVGKTPMPVEESEIVAIQAVVRSGLRAEPWPYLQVGQRVRLQGGPLSGLDGLLIETRKQHRIVVSVNLLQRSVAVEIDREWVRPVESGPQRQALVC